MPLPIILFAVAAEKATETAILWYYGGAAVVVVGGTAYMMWPSGKKDIPLTPDQKKQVKKDADEIEKRLQKPIVIAEADLVKTNGNVKTVIAQTSELQTRIDSSVKQLSKTTAKADDAAVQIINLAQPLHVAANNAVNNVQVMTKELALARKNFDEVTTALQASQQSFSEIETQLRGTRDQLSTTEKEWSDSTATTRSQLSQMLVQQQLIDDACEKINASSIQAAEIKSLKQQLGKLSSNNQSLTETVNKLSQNLITVIEENKSLRAENQRAPGQSNIEPSNANTYKPTLFR